MLPPCHAPSSSHTLLDSQGILKIQTDYFIHLHKIFRLILHLGKNPSYFPDFKAIFSPAGSPKELSQYIHARVCAWTITPRSMSWDRGITVKAREQRVPQLHPQHDGRGVASASESFLVGLWSVHWAGERGSVLGPWERGSVLGPWSLGHLPP